MSDNQIWSYVTLYLFIIGFYFLYLYLKGRDKRTLTFSIALFISSIAFTGLSLGYINLETGDTLLLWSNIFTLTSLPILFAIFLVANEPFLKVKNYDKLFYAFLLFSVVTLVLIFLPYDFSIIPKFIRQIISIEVLAVVIYRYYLTRSMGSIYFFFYIFCSMIAGVGFRLEYAHLTAFGLFISYIFLILIFLNPEVQVISGGKKILSYFALEQKLKTSNEKFRQFFDNIPTAICLLSKDRVILETNNQMANNFNMSAEEIIGKNMHDLLPPDVDKKRAEIVSNALKTGTIQKNEEKRGDKYFQNLFIPIKTENNRRNLMIISRDITTEKKLELEKEERMQYLRDTERATLNILEDMHETLQDLEQAKKEIMDKNKELTTAMKDLQSLNLELNSAREQLIDMNKNLELKVKERTAEIERLLKHKDEFIQQMGHDLKNPLGPLITLLPILKKECNKPKYCEMIDVAIRNVQYMKNLVQKTLELAQLKSPNTRLKMEKINLKEYVDNIIKDNRISLKQNSVMVFNNVSPDIQIEADQLRLQEAFNNLINNAIKYRSDTTNSIIEINAEQSNSDTTISIKDNGIGMNPEQLSHIFDEFYKADQARHDFKSSGLGMSICKRIIEMHGGKIWAESEGIGKGTTFYFTIPRKKIPESKTPYEELPLQEETAK